MPITLDLQEENKVFKCPYCRAYISGEIDVCPKCSYKLTAEAREAEVKIHDEKITEIERADARGGLYAGLIMLAIGCFPLLIVAIGQSKTAPWGEVLSGMLPYLIVIFAVVFIAARKLHKIK